MNRSRTLLALGTLMAAARAVAPPDRIPRPSSASTRSNSPTGLRFGVHDVKIPRRTAKLALDNEAIFVGRTHGKAKSHVRGVLLQEPSYRFYRCLISLTADNDGF